MHTVRPSQCPIAAILTYNIVSASTSCISDLQAMFICKLEVSLKHFIFIRYHVFKFLELLAAAIKYEVANIDFDLENKTDHWGLHFCNGELGWRNIKWNNPEFTFWKFSYNGNGLKPIGHCPITLYMTEDFFAKQILTPKYLFVMR